MTLASRWPVLASLTVALTIGTVAALSPVAVTMIAAALTSAYVLSRHALIRAAAVLVGGLAFLQVSSDISVEKIIYLGIVATSAGFSIVNVSTHWKEAKELRTQGVLAAAGVLTIMLAASSIVADLHGTPLSSWAQDMPAYFLLPVAALIGVDLAVSGTDRRWLVLLMFAVGTASAVGFTAAWWDRRNLIDIPIGRLVFPSMFLPGALISLAVAYIFTGRYMWLMSAVATALALALLLTGTRSALVVLFPVVVAFFLARGAERLRAFPALAVALVVTALAIGGIATFDTSQFIDFQTVEQRIESALPLAISGDPGADLSLYARYFETEQLLTQWETNPLFGVGPGVRWAILAYSSNATGVAIPVDSPAVPLARFGLVGTAILAAFFIALLIRTSQTARSVERTALIAFVVTVLIWAAFSSPLDDKGVAFGLIPLIALCTAAPLSNKRQENYHDTSENIRSGSIRQLQGDWRRTASHSGVPL